MTINGNNIGVSQPIFDGCAVSPACRLKAVGKMHQSEHGNEMLHQWQSSPIDPTGISPTIHDWIQNPS